jgi:hypothetical protein
LEGDGVLILATRGGVSAMLACISSAKAAETARLFAEFVRRHY